MKRRLVTKLMMAAGVAAMAVTTIPASVFAAEDGGQTYGVTYWCESDFFKTVADSCLLYTSHQVYKQNQLQIFLYQNGLVPFLFLRQG